MLGDCVLTTDVSKDKDGYPRVKHQGKMWRLNRLIFTFVHGEIPLGYVVGHSCNNPECINPKHLYLTTSAENSAHAARDGLYRKGVENGMARFTVEQVKEIRRLGEIGTTQQKIADLFKASQAAISAILRNKTYKDI